MAKSLRVPPPPYLPPKYEKKHVQALQALARHNADEIQQEIVLKWVIEDLCKTYDLSFRSENTHDTAFAEGRRFVGLELVRLIRAPIHKLFSSQLREHHEN